MPDGPALLWFRNDLRLEYNEALRAALAGGGTVLPVFILDDAGDGLWAAGGAARWWLHGSLAALGESLRRLGSRLVLRRGDSVELLSALVADSGARRVCWTRGHDPLSRRRDAAVCTALAAQGVECCVADGQLLFDPATVRNRAGGPFQVFTPFWRHCRTLTLPSRPAGAPLALRAPVRWPRSDVLEDWALRPRLGWAAEFGATGSPGEGAARARLASFVMEAMDAYREHRDRPALDGTSRLSAALHWGELSPRQIWDAVEAASRESGVMPRSRGAQVFLDEVGWREFAHHLLWHFPATPEAPLRSEYATFPSVPDGALLEAWQLGRTGYPIVDAGMRQLWRTGWMHNRVRMIVASFLVKQLLQPWQAGAAWFWDTLVDADLANNTLGWQWSAGCGADAAPYFRIFNPVRQGERFDPDGAYVRRWVPELAQLPAAAIHCPWEAAPLDLAEAGVRLGASYPWPIIEPAEGRARALRALAEWKAARIASKTE